MKLLKTSNNFLFFPLSTLILMLGSCSTSYESGFNHHKNKININLSKHNLAYQFVHDSLFGHSAQKQIDSFDFIFLTQFRSKILSRGYQIKADSAMQTMRLENCLIDFSYGQPLLIKYTYDSFYVNQFATTLVCQTNMGSSQLFSATYDTYQEFEIESKSNAKSKLNPTKTWYETQNYYYHLKPISPNQNYLIARNLSERAAVKLDSLNEVTFVKTYPDLASKSYRKKDNGDLILNGFLKFIGIVAITLIAIIANP